jgi:hypothetical protein
MEYPSASWRIIFGWCENILVGISFVFILFFNGQMELANHLPLA